MISKFFRFSAKPDLLDNIKSSNIDAVNQLLDKGVSPNIKDKQGCPAIIHAIHASNSELLRRLIEAGADVNAKNKEGLTALHKAASSDKIELVRVLLQSGADVNARTSRNITPLMAAAEKGNASIIQVLIKEGGADPNIKDKDGWTALMFAVSGKWDESIKILIELGADVNTKEQISGRTALIAASGTRSSYIVEALIRAGANVNAQDNEGHTPLISAAARQDGLNRPSVVKILLDAGADVEAKVAKGVFAGKTALAWAKMHEDRETIKLIEAARVKAKRVGLCASCHKSLKPFSSPGGMWAGTISDLTNLPKIEPDSGFVCEGCSQTICPVCSGKKAGELGIREFVCTECGYKPLKTVYRAT